MVERTHIWRFKTEEEAQNFDRMVDLGIFYFGAHVSEILSKIVEHWLRINDNGIVLVDEKTLLVELMRQGTPSSHVTIKNYRDQGKLIEFDARGRCLWASDGRNVVYDLKGCLNFFLSKRKRNFRMISGLEETEEVA